MSSRNQTLPKNFQPRHYVIEINDLDVENNSFSGHVVIDLKCIDPSDTVFLNSRDISISSAVVEIDGREVNCSSTQYDTASEVLEFKFSEEFTNDIKIHIDYIGCIQTNMSGFYRSDFQDPLTGNPQYMLSTQFEATDARRAFPCMDEPLLKASFDVSIVAPSNCTVLSNMPLKSAKTLTEQDLIMHRFHTTPLMSTYLVAWAIGELEYIEGHTEMEIYPSIEGYSTQSGLSPQTIKLPIRVYTVKGKSQQGQFALSVAAKVIDYFSSLFDIPYPLPKLDLLCVETYSHNAMENFSLITFRPTALLFEGDVNSGNPLALQKIAYVVSHEIAHQWFGNLVTMKWWDELWLNEGFATWVGYHAVAKFFPQWDVPSLVMWKSHEVALELDSLRESHPVKVNVRNAKDIDQVFDSISYLKGCSVLEMISGFLGEDAFLKGVALYLKNNKFSNATMEALFDSITEATGVNVLRRLQDWILKIGFPLITVSRLENGDVSVTQSMFSSTSVAPPNNPQPIWWLPLMLTNQDHLENLELSKKSMAISLPKDQFIFFNTDGYGFYRVKYEDRTILKTICKNIDSLSSRSKMALISDLQITGSADTLLDVISHFIDSQDPNDYYVWAMLINACFTLSSLLYRCSDHNISTKLNQFILKLIENQLDDALKYLENPDAIILCKDDEKRALKAQFYEQILIAAGLCSYKKVVTQCSRLFAEEKVTAINRNIVLTTVLCQDDTPLTIFEQVVKELATATLTHKEIILTALGKVQNPQLFDASLNLIFKAEPMDLQFLAESWGSNPNIRSHLWNYIKMHYDRIYERISLNSTVTDRFFRFSLKDLVGLDLRRELANFFKGKNLDGFDRGIRQTLERIEKNTAYANSNINGVKEFFNC
ncbi:LAFE_0D07008g1_1 [Lachancea fermentati]|uniref:Aminopeptidase n=1 Tax=Lachancea fermentati TaxID=4955 RepID=A0A1G4MBY1_LACFM|nr:LAFE_0D07008g1_1 [Lachancea fermentati]